MRLVRDDMYDTQALTRLLYQSGVASPPPEDQPQGVNAGLGFDMDLALPAAPRSPVSATVRLAAIDNAQDQASKPLPILATDVSSAGLTAISESPLEEDTLYLAELSSLVGQPYQQTARVVYCRPVLKQTFRIGLAFAPYEG